MLKYLPNLLTLSRLALIIPFLFCLFNQNYIIAFYIFLFAGLTDGFDGWLARRFHWQTHFGSFLDPLADKLLVAASFISLALLKRLPWWLVILVFLRDLTIIIGVICWHYFIHREVHFKPSLLSKINTAFQLSLVTLCLIELAFFITPSYLTAVLILITAMTTLASYLDYVLTWSRIAYSMQHKKAHD